MRHWFLVSVVFATGCTVLAPGAHLDEAQRGDPRAVGDHSTVRVVTWNIETLGAPGSDEYEAAQQILAHLDADVVLLQEVQWDEDSWRVDDFAADAGYPEVHDGWPVTFGTDTQLILSRYPMSWRLLLDADDLSPDRDAADLTRAVPVAGIDIDGTELVVASVHLKSGERNIDEFRRTIDAQRAVQSVQPFDTHDDLVLIGGDLNDDLLDAANSPRTWTTHPSGAPWSFELGDDLADQLYGAGIPNDVFTPFEEAGLVFLDAEQLAGGDTTRPQSGRRLDYLAVSQALVEGARTEVYDTYDAHLGGLPKPGPVPTRSTLTAADHLPVVVDLILPSADPLEPTEPTHTVPVDALEAGDLVITEVMPNPDACSDEVGEWVEVQNRREEPVDLAGLQLCDRAQCVAVQGAGVVAAGGVAVLARSTEACVPQVDGTFGAALSNGGDDVVLRGAVELDAVDYPDGNAGKPWVFDDDGACELDEATPGEAWTCDGEPLSLPADTGTEPAEPWTLADVPAGTLRLTEVMANPSACGDDVGEWVELHNTGDRAVDLTGLRLADNSGSTGVDTAHLLAAGDRAVLARSWEACDPTEVHGTFSVALSNGGDLVELLRPDDELLDAMSYGDADPGEVWVRDGEAWCTSDTPTPLAAEPACL